MVGLSITSIAFFMFALVPVTPGASSVLIALAVLGLGNGLFISAQREPQSWVGARESPRNCFRV